MPLILHLLRRHALPTPISCNGLDLADGFTIVLINSILSGVLVLVGGLFAGLTLAYVLNSHQPCLFADMKIQIDRSR
jgi:hypothetical protein